MAAISIMDVVKSYGAITTIHGVNLEIADGEFIILVGPSGCGKSTLLRMIAGLETISGGEVAIGDVIVNDLDPKDRDIAMVFQNYALYPHMKVRDNMSFSLKLAKRTPEEQEKMVARAASILDLTHLLDRYPRQLSGGQRQRVAMGRAIVRDPAVFLFDEPLSNLDAKLRVQMRGEIKALHQRLKSTMMYVTHDQMEAMTMADRIVVLRAGIIEQVGTPMELYDMPTNNFVATFIGSPSMNLIEGTVAGDGTGPVLVAEGGHRWPLPSDVQLKQGDKVQLGARPEHIMVADSGIEGTVTLVEPTGAETHAQLRVGEQNVTAVFRDRLNVGLGQPVRFSLDLAKSHVFDAASGARLPRGRAA